MQLTRLYRALLTVTAGLAVACGTDRVPRSDAFVPTASDASADGPQAGPPAACAPARTAERLPARVQVTSEQAGSAGGSSTIFARDLFGQWKSHCGQCHVDVKQGNFQVSESTFALEVGKALVAMKSDDPAKFMPPAVLGGKPYSQRMPGDPVVELVTLLERWVAAGKPNPLVIAGVERQPGEGAERYLLPPEIAGELTNLGDCIPDRSIVGTATEKMDQLDGFFAQAKQLPDKLAETDFVALDSQTLARHGVISFAPAYPLWSDNAGKMRYVRVPRGKSITFDKASQQFSIPDSTRFYKTFLKKVVDRDGNESFRKIETRLIVTRLDTQTADGTVVQNALYGSYVWNEEETEAVLLREPLRNGKPFTDKVLTYIVDEPRAQEIRETTTSNIAYAMEQAPGVLRRYAVPGGTRCVECHMGSPSASFSLGFSPLQIHRRPMGEGGIIEPSGEDELTQLQRFIDYGLVTGLSAVSEVLPLEKSQGSRPPRTGEELIAQGYMLGNCSGCHNPRGFPTTKNRELRDLLNFLPGPEGGIFEFPLERYSPRIKRGPNLDEPIPYITPSLRDLPRHFNAYQFTEIRTPKWQWDQYNKEQPVDFIDAPWRSLIYRNVDAPFTYSDDYAIFPRMPRNTPSFDCRAPRIMAEWMVSIPATRKSPMTSEHALPPEPGSDPQLNPDRSDHNAQPYLEVKRGDPGYEAAVASSQGRLAAFREGKRGRFCPDTEDILDRRVKGLVLVPPDETILDPQSKKPMLGLDSVPDRPHWVPTDLTEPEIDWLPRRSDWDKVLAPDKPEHRQLAPHQQKDQQYRSVLEALDHVRITDDLRQLALTEVPFGVWKAKPECDRRLGNARKLSDFSGAARPAWMDADVIPKRSPDARVYMSAPGAAVFNAICINCHGPKADSRGLQAETLAEMTGGDARVANLRDGLLGATRGGTRNIERVFGPMAGLYPKGALEAQPVSAEDWAGRYVAWMALGGTEKRIPQAILNNVGASEVLGEKRNMREAKVSSPNMLQAAEQLCRNAIPHVSAGKPINLITFFRGAFDWGAETALISKNGDADMWRRLCSFRNRRIVRVARDYWNWDPAHPPEMVLQSSESYYWADGYPIEAPVMNQDGKIVTGFQPDNLFAICAEKPAGAEQLERATRFLRDNPVGGAGGQVMPFCPDPLIKTMGDDGLPRWKMKIEETDRGTEFVDVGRWAARGAINAGLSVMLYLDQIKKGKAPTPRYDHCQELEATPAVTP